MQKQNSAPYKSFIPTGLQHSATSKQAIPAQSSAPVIVHPPPVIHSSKVLELLPLKLFFKSLCGNFARRPTPYSLKIPS
ncbi:hypothetical protein CEXT_807271 [Caerostris extrusa]|uniref:Uncharacterized protein n=1 Tax=Caerostris extrusa TaxID=172846 RepID=A0AAV4MPC6_CAEEX|nr:hypothetical protein CEXT_807271 [Caerostris extrusa]